MTEQTIVALVSAIGVLGAAGIAALTATQHRTRERIKDLTAKVDRTRAENHALWLYTRMLIDHIYRGAGAPPPDPPDYISGLFQIGDPQ